MTNQERDQSFDVVYAGAVRNWPPARQDSPSAPVRPLAWGRVIVPADLAVEAVETCLAQRPCTLPIVRAATGLSLTQVTTAIQRLRRAGKVTVLDQRVSKPRGRPYAVYALEARG